MSTPHVLTLTLGLMPLTMGPLTLMAQDDLLESGPSVQISCIQKDGFDRTTKAFTVALDHGQATGEFTFKSHAVESKVKLGATFLPSHIGTFTENPDGSKVLQVGHYIGHRTTRPLYKVDLDLIFTPVTEASGQYKLKGNNSFLYPEFLPSYYNEYDFSCMFTETEVK